MNPSKTSRKRPYLGSEHELYVNNVNSSRLTNIRHTEPYQHFLDFLDFIPCISKCCICKLLIYSILIIIVFIFIAYITYQVIFNSECIFASRNHNWRISRDWRDRRINHCRRIEFSLPKRTCINYTYGNSMQNISPILAILSRNI